MLICGQKRSYGQTYPLLRLYIRKNLRAMGFHLNRPNPKMGEWGSWENFNKFKLFSAAVAFPEG
jgi:hypothetical protein